MNVYFMNPRYISSEKINIFLEVLKVNQIINLINPESYHIPNIDSKIEIYNYFTEDKDKLLKEAVYKFITPISKPIIDNGKWTGNNKVMDLYKNSYSGNPIHNLIKCDEYNTFIFCENEISFCTKHANYTIAILNKYAENLTYSNRICFCYIDSLLSSSLIYLPNSRNYEFCFLNLTKRNGNRYYNPLISYLNIKTNELYPYHQNNIDIYKFFLTKEGYHLLLNKKFKTHIETIISKEESKHDQTTHSNYYEIDYGTEELDYMRENGGDWMFD